MHDITKTSNFPYSPSYKWVIQRMSSFAQHSPFTADTENPEEVQIMLSL